MQKQPPEVFRRKSFFSKFCKFHRKTPVLKCIFNKVCKNFAKKRLQHRCLPVKFAEFLKTPTFEEHLPNAVSIYEIGSCYYFLYYFTMDKKGTHVLRSWSRSKILFEKFFNKLRKKTHFYPYSTSGTALHEIVTYLMLIQQHFAFCIVL